MIGFRDLVICVAWCGPDTFAACLCESRRLLALLVVTCADSALLALDVFADMQQWDMATQFCVAVRAAPPAVASAETFAEVTSRTASLCESRCFLALRVLTSAYSTILADHCSLVCRSSNSLLLCLSHTTVVFRKQQREKRIRFAFVVMHDDNDDDHDDDAWPSFCWPEL